MASNTEKRNFETPAPAEDSDYEHLIEDYSHLAPPSEGELLQGRVVKVTPKEVIVDFGYKIEGLVPIEEVTLPDGSVTVQPEDIIDVVIDRHKPQPEGYILLSHERAARLRAWETLERAHRENLPWRHRDAAGYEPLRAQPTPTTAPLASTVRLTILRRNHAAWEQSARPAPRGHREGESASRLDGPLRSPSRQR